MIPTVPIIPDSAPFSAEQRAWLNGYLAGLFARGSAATFDSAPEAGDLRRSQGASARQLVPLTILYGSQTGTSETLAKQAAKLAAAKQFVATVVDMAAASADMLVNAKHILIITSTYGEGEPPDNAKDFWSALSADSFPKLTGIPFSVFALGDTNYEKFCQFGKDLDQRLEALGAKRIFERFDADTDYEEGFAQWSAGALDALASVSSEGGFSADPAVATQDTAAPESPDQEKYSKKNPFPAKMKTNHKLSLAGSEKETRHFEIQLDDSLTYEAGDALGVIPQNNPLRVGKVMTHMGFSPDTIVNAGENMPLVRALTEIYDLKNLPAELMDERRLAPTGMSSEREQPASAQDLIAKLKKIQPRLYSISSSPKAHPNEVHLTVSVVRYVVDGAAREGLCSTFLADRVGEQTLPVYIHRNSAFRLPADTAKPVIMVGPGTGIAPFRAFLEERRETGATGKNVLFFGEQRSACDFYYRDELERMVKDNFLNLHTAFSRDQQEKIYVQHRMLENAAKIFDLLEQGAYFYVCGDAAKMAKDVDLALLKIAETAGGKSADRAKEYMQALRSQKRYLRDVY